MDCSASAENDFKKSDNKVDVKNDKKEAAEISEQRTKVSTSVSIVIIVISSALL